MGQIGLPAFGFLGILILTERLAVACPFCGGGAGGADELLQIVLVVAGIGLVGRALMRAAKRRRTRPPESAPKMPG